MSRPSRSYVNSFTAVHSWSTQLNIQIIQYFTRKWGGQFNWEFGRCWGGDNINCVTAEKISFYFICHSNYQAIPCFCIWECRSNRCKWNLLVRKCWKHSTFMPLRLKASLFCCVRIWNLFFNTPNIRLMAFRKVECRRLNSSWAFWGLLISVSLR